MRSIPPRTNNVLDTYYVRISSIENFLGALKVEIHPQKREFPLLLPSKSMINPTISPYVAQKKGGSLHCVRGKTLVA